MEPLSLLHMQSPLNMLKCQMKLIGLAHPSLLHTCRTAKVLDGSRPKALGKRRNWAPCHVLTSPWRKGTWRHHVDIDFPLVAASR